MKKNNFLQLNAEQRDFLYKTKCILKEKGLRVLFDNGKIQSS